MNRAANIYDFGDKNGGSIHREYVQAWHDGVARLRRELLCGNSSGKLSGNGRRQKQKYERHS
jgi:hypothetical protein